MRHLLIQNILSNRVAHTFSEICAFSLPAPIVKNLL